eukprot:1625267-Pyramimonas_sp.AAC.1
MRLMTTFPLASCRRAPHAVMHQSRGLAHHQFGTSRLMEALISKCNTWNDRSSSGTLRVWAKRSDKKKLERKLERREENRELEERLRIAKEKAAQEARKKPPSVPAPTTCEHLTYQFHNANLSTTFPLILSLSSIRFVLPWVFKGHIVYVFVNSAEEAHERVETAAARVQTAVAHAKQLKLEARESDEFDPDVGYKAFPEVSPCFIAFIKMVHLKLIVKHEDLHVHVKGLTKCHIVTSAQVMDAVEELSACKASFHEEVLERALFKVSQTRSVVLQGDLLS